MNIYADRGQPAGARAPLRPGAGIGCELTAAGLRRPRSTPMPTISSTSAAARTATRCCAPRDLVETKRDALHAAAERGALVLGICGGFQLLGHVYELGDEEIPGLGLVDLRTVREDGPTADRQRRDRGRTRRRRATRPRGLREPRRAVPIWVPASTPLGRVLRGHGNDGRSGAGGRATRRRDRDVPPRPAAAEEHVVRRLAHRRAATGRANWPRSTTAFEAAAHASARGARASRRPVGRLDSAPSPGAAPPATAS